MINKFIQFLGIIKKAGKLIEGYNKCEDSILKSKIYLIILSSESSLNTKEKFHNYCEKRNIPIIENFSKFELGNIIGKSEINILGVCDKKMSIELIKLWNK